MFVSQFSKCLGNVSKTDRKWYWTCRSFMRVLTLSRSTQFDALAMVNVECHLKMLSTIDFTLSGCQLASTVAENMANEWQCIHCQSNEEEDRGGGKKQQIRWNFYCAHTDKSKLLV